MALIDKDKVIAEINELQEKARDLYGCSQFDTAYDNVLKAIDTIEVKDVDLEKEIELIKGDYEQVDVAWNKDFDFIARHFFELGLKAKEGKEL